MTKALRHSMIVLTAFLFLIGSATRVATQRAAFDPNGSFWIIGEPPEAFKDFGGINLNAKRNRRLPKPGVDLVNGKNYRFKILNVSRASFSFTTVTVGGVSYTFKGKFLRGGVFIEQDLEETPVLEGTLTKFRRGHPPVEAKLQFSYFGGT